MSLFGQTIRLGLKDIPSLGRATQGVRIMRLNAGDKVVSLALVEKVEEDEEEEAPVGEQPKAKAAKKPQKPAAAKPKAKP